MRELRNEKLRFTLGKALGLGASLFLLGCAAASPLPAQQPAPEAGPDEPAHVSRPELTADEIRLKETLVGHLELLATKIGERHPDKLWELAEAADYLANSLESMGFLLERQGYETADVAAQNIAVTVSGGARGDEVLIVTTHYDTRVGAGRTGASGAAVLLEVARLLRDAQLDRTLKLVFLSMGESPHGDGEGRGALHYSRKFVADASKKPPEGALDPSTQVNRVEALGAIHLGALDVFSRGESAPDIDASLLEIQASSGAEVLVQALRRSMSDDPFRVKTQTLTSESPESDGTVFSAAGIPSLVISGGEAKPDQGFSENEIAQFAMRFRYAIGEILGEKPTNDGMVTPLP